MAPIVWIIFVAVFCLWTGDVIDPDTRADGRFQWIRPNTKWTSGQHLYDICFIIVLCLSINLSVRSIKVKF